MKILSHKTIEFSEVMLQELTSELRFDADYYQPEYLRNDDIIKEKKPSLINGSITQKKVEDLQSLVAQTVRLCAHDVYSQLVTT